MSGRSVNKWLVLALATLVHMFVVGLPWTVMPVLMTAASQEMHLSLGDMGMVWSMLPIGAATVALLGGMIGDRLGFTRAIAIGCFAVAVANGLRGVATNTATLTASMFLTGATVALVFPNVQRLAGVFFPRAQVGLATGISVSGFAVGGVLTTALSATVLMPLVGSWRNVLFVFSGLCVVMGVVWLVVMRGAAPPAIPGREAPADRPSFGKSMAAVFRVKEVWLLSLGNLGVVGAFISLNGYLPVYLEESGLSKSVGDTMSSMLFAASIVGAIGIPALADRLNASKMVMILSGVFTAVAILLMTASVNALFWVLIPLVGCVTQGVGSLVISHAVRNEEVGAASAGTALGLIGGFANLGGFVLPLAGGRLADLNETWPFILWAATSALGTTCFLLLRKAPGARVGRAMQRSALR